MTTGTASVGKPDCRLVGTDGNAFAVIATVSRCLKLDGQPDRADAWRAEAFRQTSCDALLQLLFAYVEAR